MFKRIFLIIGFLFFPLLLRANVNKTEFIKKFSEAQKIQEQGLSGNMEINMSMMGIQQKISGKFWTKEGLFRLGTNMQIPDQSSPVESTIVFDGKTFWNNIGNTMIMKINVDKLPLQFRNTMKNFASFGMDFEKNINKYYKNINVIEEVKNGSQYYVASLFPKDLKSNISQSQSSIKKIILWINEKNMLIKKIEVYGVNGQLEMLARFKNLIVQPIPSSMFIFIPPENVQVMDMTSMVANMMTGQMQNMGKSVQTETHNTK